MTRRQLFRLARELGWRPFRRARHGYLLRRGDAVVSVPHTPSDWRSLANTMADLRRRPHQEETT